MVRFLSPSLRASLREIVSLAVPEHAESQVTVNRARPWEPVRGRFTTGGLEVGVGVGVTVGVGVGVTVGVGVGSGPIWMSTESLSEPPSLSVTVTIAVKRRLAP